MKPLFAVLKAHHMGSNVTAPQVYEAIGYRAGKWLDPAWANTCAIRMSIALIAAGGKIRPGRLQIKAGPFRGAMVEPGQRNLSDFLVGEIGQPEKF